MLANFNLNTCNHTLTTVLIVLFSFSVWSTHGQQDPMNDQFMTPEGLISHLYDQVTFPAGETPDWDYVRTMFIPQATVVMRMGPAQTATLTLDGWILDFVNFIHNAEVKSTGFEEKIIKMETTEFGAIAHSLVLYTSFIPGRSKAPREGVDSFHLIKKEGRWWIVSILNEIPGPNRPKPEVLK